MPDFSGFDAIILYQPAPNVVDQVRREAPRAELTILDHDADHFLHWTPHMADLLYLGADPGHRLRTLLALTRRLVISEVPITTGAGWAVCPDLTYHRRVMPRIRPTRLEIWTRFDRYFEEVYLCLQGWLASLDIPYQFKGTYYPAAGEEMVYQPEVAYLFLSAPEVVAPRHHPRAFSMLWYFEQPTAGYWASDRNRGWFSQVDCVLCPWPGMVERLKSQLPWQAIEYLPYRYDLGLRLRSPDLQVSAWADRPIDVFFAGCLNSQRERIRQELTACGLKVMFVNAVFGPDLDTLIAQSKVSLNIHYYPGAYLEVHRINRLLAYGSRVISEPSADPVTDLEYAPYLEYASLDEMSRKVVAIIGSGNEGRPDFATSAPLQAELTAKLTPLLQ